MMNIILLAAPAAGKGTLSELLQKEYHLAHISTGDLLREAATLEDELGKKIKDILASGKLVSDEIVYDLLMRRLAEPDCQNGFILDGFPRNVEQAKKYDEILDKLHLSLGYVFLLDVDKTVLESRITGRRLCSKCGAIYNVNVAESKPKKDGICDRCGGTLYQRDDDNSKSFQVRYDTYLEKTSPLIDFYQQRNLLYRIDAGKDKVYTFEQAKQILDKEK